LGYLVVGPEAIERDMVRVNSLNIPTSAALGNGGINPVVTVRKCGFTSSSAGGRDIDALPFLA
jgi:hypothetical protein